ncbi:MAG: GNAT family N-acetyltransferase [Gammaproteobacteria bacterium]|nr:GNAT family N-acetyltransferase [Gammaproteobacteria bacterium]
MQRRPDGSGATPDVRIADFGADNAAIRRIRFAVFVDEQKVPEEIEIDERDPFCVHVLAYLNGEAVGTGRVDVAREHGAAGKIGRVAVLAEARRHGVGAAIMRALHRIAAERGLSSVWCHAQVAAVPFYERLGYRSVGERFDEAGIEHVRMERTEDGRA